MYLHRGLGGGLGGGLGRLGRRLSELLRERGHGPDRRLRRLREFRGRLRLGLLGLPKDRQIRVEDSNITAEGKAKKLASRTFEAGLGGSALGGSGLGLGGSACRQKKVSITNRNRNRNECSGALQ